MWCLSRTPNSSPNRTSIDLSLFTSRDSIFPISETGICEGISIIEVPNEINQQQQKLTCSSSNSWEWFAYLCSPSRIHSVAVPRFPSFRIQVIAVLPERFLCAKFSLGVDPNATLCSYSFEGNMFMDVPKLQCEDHNLIGTSAAIHDGYLYLAGGFKGSPSNVETSSYLTVAERLNLKTWKWEVLPPMTIPRAFATGLIHNNKFYVIGGGATIKNSAEIFDPNTNSWKLQKSFVPKEADGFAVATLNMRLLMLTWSDRLGVKLWVWIELVNPYLIGGGWRWLSIFPNQGIERVRLREHGARLVRVGKELWVMVGKRENDNVYQVDGGNVWPVFPAPIFRPDDGIEVVHKSHIYAFYFKDFGLRIGWRRIPVYAI